MIKLTNCMDKTKIFGRILKQEMSWDQMRASPTVQQFPTGHPVHQEYISVGHLVIIIGYRPMSDVKKL